MVLENTHKNREIKKRAHKKYNTEKKEMHEGSTPAMQKGSTDEK